MIKYFACLICFVGTSAFAQDRLDLPDLSAYLTLKSDGLITSALEKSSNLNRIEYKIDSKRSAYRPVYFSGRGALTHAFHFDIEGFIRKSGAADFLSAKDQYYRSLSFNQDTQRFQYRYFRPSDWKGLFFPPQVTLDLPFDRYDQGLIPRANLPSESIYDSADWHKQVDELTGTELTQGNKLLILSNGDSFAKKLELVRQSQTSISISVMTFLCDSGSREMVEALGERAAAGVRVTVISEGLWTHVVARGCVAKLKRNGIEVITANDLTKLGEEHSYLHAKFWIFDEKEAIIGGQNMVNSDNLSTGFNGRNRDVDVYVKGPAVTDLMEAYLKLYDRYVHRPGQIRRRVGLEDYRSHLPALRSEQIASHVRGQSHYNEWFSNASKRNQGICRFTIQGPEGDSSQVSKTYIEYIKAAEHSLQLTSPTIDQGLDAKEETYNVLFWEAVREKVTSGVKLDFITNGIDGGAGELTDKLSEFSDHVNEKGHIRLSNWLVSAIHLFDKGSAKKMRPDLEMLAGLPGTRIYTHFHYYHGKTLDFDRKVVAIGSYNFDKTSAELNHEAGLICGDEDLAAQQDSILLRDRINSEPVFEN